MNPVAWFVPGVRANGTTFFLGLLVFLAAHVALTAVQLYTDIALPDGTGLIFLAVLLLLLVFVHLNRLNDAGRSWTWVFLPIPLALVAFFVVVMIFGTMYFFQQLGVYAEANSLDSATVMQDPALMQEFQTWIENNEGDITGLQLVAAWGSTGAFWAVILLFGLWFRGMPSREA